MGSYSGMACTHEIRRCPSLESENQLGVLRSGTVVWTLANCHSTRTSTNTQNISLLNSTEKELVDHEGEVVRTSPLRTGVDPYGDAKASRAGTTLKQRSNPRQARAIFQRNTVILFGTDPFWTMGLADECSISGRGSGYGVKPFDASEEGSVTVYS